MFQDIPIRSLVGTTGLKLLKSYDLQHKTHYEKFRNVLTELEFNVSADLKRTGFLNQHSVLETIHHLMEYGLVGLEFIQWRNIEFQPFYSTDGTTYGFSLFEMYHKMNHCYEIGLPRIVRSINTEDIIRVITEDHNNPNAPIYRIKKELSPKNNTGGYTS